MEETFSFDRFCIERALDHEIVADVTDQGAITIPCTKEEADKIILETFDKAVHQCLAANDVACVLQDIIMNCTDLTEEELVQILVESFAAKAQNKTEDFDEDDFFDDDSDDTSDNIVEFPSEK